MHGPPFPVTLLPLGVRYPSPGHRTPAHIWLPHCSSRRRGFNPMNTHRWTHRSHTPPQLRHINRSRRPIHSSPRYSTRSHPKRRHYRRVILAKAHHSPLPASETSLRPSHAWSARAACLAYGPASIRSNSLFSPLDTSPRVRSLNWLFPLWRKRSSRSLSRPHSTNIKQPALV